MRRSTFALLTIIAAATTGCVVPQAARSARFASFGDAAAATDAHAAPAPLRRSKGQINAMVDFVRDHRAQLEYCRDLERATNPAFGGTANLEVTLEDNGYVLRAKVTDRSWNAEGARMEDCMLTAIRRWDFPDSGPLDEFVHSFRVTIGDGDTRVESLDTPTPR
jgi:hypothetical protein